MSWHYTFVTKMIRKEGKIWFHKGDDHFFMGWKDILSVSEEFEIKNPSVLQKNRFIIISGPILVETDAITDIIYTDNMGRRALSKDVKILGWF